MKRTTLDAADAPVPAGGYAQSVGIEGFRRIVFVSGQIPVDGRDAVPDGFEAQARLVWSNVDAQLKAQGMSRENIVKLTIFLSDRGYADLNGRIRRDYLGDLRPAMTVLIAGIFDEAWLLEVEAVAAA